MVCKTKPTPINLSFSGCGFLGVYHVGVMSAFKEHAPEILQNKMAGCSAGSLVAACAMSHCCLGQMCSDALEIAMRARTHILGALHPTFDIVGIIRNGLRRILPPNAHEICSGRLFISLTRWKDNKNVIVNQFHNREELIQVLICSSFVPYWSGMLPEKFRGEYYWDGGLTNNSPIVDEGTILISPFAGESDICPRDESGSFYSVDFRGTDISCTQENLYRMTRSLFPPELSVLKQLCLRGYIDGLKFLKSRNMLISSHVNTKTSMSSVFGSDFTEPTHENERELANGGANGNDGQVFEQLDDTDDDDYDDDSSDESAYQSNGERSDVPFSPFCDKVPRAQELPTSLFTVFADARQREEYPIRRCFTGSRIYTAWSLITLPVTLPIDLTYAATKRVLGIVRSSTNTTARTLPNRVVNFLWSFVADENGNRSCYHVNDCECTESRVSSITAQPPYVLHRPRRLSSRSNRHSNSVRMSTVASNSSRSDLLSPDEDESSINHGDIQCVCSEPNLTEHLPQPDLVGSIKCRNLQQMADLSN